MTDEVVEILERAATKYADDLALQTVGENPPPRKGGRSAGSKKDYRRCLFLRSGRVMGSLRRI